MFENQYEMLEKYTDDSGIILINAKPKGLLFYGSHIINFVQDQHQKTARFRIIPSKMDGDVKFIFAEKRDKRQSNL